jgi:hypothetical protein
VLWLAPEKADPEQAADIGQDAPVASFAPELVGDVSPAVPDFPAVPDSPAGLTDAPELTSGDGTIADDVDPAYALDDTDEPPAVDAAPAVDDADGTAPPVPVATDTDVDAGPVPSATDADAHFPGDAPEEFVERHADLLDGAPSAGVSADAPVVAPEVPQVEVEPLGTGPEDVPADAAYEEEPPEFEATPGAPDAVADEPRFSSEIGERPVPVGGRPEALDAATPSATRSPLDDPAPDFSESDDESSTHQ